MNVSKWRYIMGTVTIIAIIGGTVYAIKKSKDLEKIEESEISLEEARALVEIHRKQKSDHMSPTSSYKKFVKSKKVDAESDDRKYAKMEEDYDKGKGIFDPECEHVSSEDEYEEEEEEPLIDDGQPTTYGKDKQTEEDSELRYEPSSKDARNQFIKMELSEWRPLEDVYQTMTKLFEFPFQPQNDGDDMLRTQIIDYRVRFFGFNSKWSQEVTIADVILHYGRAAEFNCGESIRYWVEYFLDFNELDFTQTSRMIDELLNILNSHTYFNEERQTFGLFGLTRNSMDQAIKIANRNVDRSVTYEIEFNEFLKSCL